MAIKKTIPSEFGLPITHWKANNIIFDYEKMTAISTANGYFSEALMDDPKAKSVAQSTVTARAFWYKEDYLNALPKKPEMLVTLEAKSSLTDEEKVQKESLTKSYQESLDFWTKNNPSVIIEEHPDLFQAIVTLIKYQTQFHLQSSDLGGGEFIEDKLPMRPTLN